MIIKTFNPVFFGLFIIFGLFTLCLKLCLKRADERQRQLFVAFFYTAILVYFFVYKYQLSKDVEYSGIQALSGAGNFSWWTELPLNLCNISLVVIPLAFFFKKRTLMSFGFFVSPLGALLALLMPVAGFSGYSFFTPRVCGFYFTHYAIFFSLPIVLSLKLYKPEKRDIMPCFAVFMIIASVVFVINVLIRVLGFSQFSNYFYEMSPVNNPVLGFLYNLIPVPGLYLLPVMVGVLIPYMYLITLILGKYTK